MENQQINPLKNPEEYQKQVLDSMRHYEILIGELYAIYAQKIPKHKEFWNEIAREEGTHAYWLKTLQEKIGGGDVFLDEKRFHIAAIKQCIDDVEQKIKSAKSFDVDMIVALSISNDIENGMIEGKFFEVFESDSADIKETFEMLERATLQHRERVEAFWEIERARIGVKSKKTLVDKIKNFFS